jgi:7-cyano-7-deazaguanine synthase in queuosine biosynthesis
VSVRVQLFSGGLDSLCLWYLTGRPEAVYVRVGAPYEKQEEQTVRRLTYAIPGFQPRFVNGPDLSGLVAPDGHIPVRNLLLAATAVAHTGAGEVILGAVLGEASPDKSRRFLKAASTALSRSEGRLVTLAAPAHRWTKTGLLRRFLAAHPDRAHLVAQTRSCYAAEEVPCGDCQACFRRNVALWHAGLNNTPPRLPSGGVREAWTALRTVGLTRLPGVAASNALAGLALAGLRRPA